MNSFNHTNPADQAVSQHLNPSLSRVDGPVRLTAQVVYIAPDEGALYVRPGVEGNLEHWEASHPLHFTGTIGDDTAEVPPVHTEAASGAERRRMRYEYARHH